MKYPSVFNRETPLQNWVIGLGILVTCAGLIFLAYLGIYNRYWSDDWCYNVDFENLGIMGTVDTYFMTGEQALRGYSTNRYSLTLLSGFLYSAGIFGAQSTATLVILCWMAGLLWVFSNLSKACGFSSRNILFFGAVILLYYTLYLSPHRFQVLYWMAGIHYSFSIITGLCLAGLITYQVNHVTRSRVIDVLAFPLAFLAGGLSEIGCVYLIGCTMLALMATIYWRQKKSDWALKAFPTMVVIFLGLACSLAALVFSPSNEARLDTFSGDRTPLLSTLLTSLRFSYDFMFNSLSSLPLPHLVFVVTFMSLSLTSTSDLPITRAIWWERLLTILAVTSIVWLLIAAIQMPTMYVYKTPPDPRGQSLSRFTMLAGLAVSAWLIGRTLRSWYQGKWSIMLALFSLVLSIVYTLRTVLYIYSELPSFVERAALWDERDLAIRAARVQGITRMEVIAIDMKDVNTRDIMQSDVMENWTTSCASRYYGLEEIRAIPPIE